jgi:hypothetical protein
LFYAIFVSYVLIFSFYFSFVKSEGKMGMGIAGAMFAFLLLFVGLRRSAQQRIDS